MAEMHTSRDNPFTSEKVHIYNDIENVDISDVGAGKYPTLRPQTEKDYLAEIARLNASTKHFISQTRALRAQGELISQMPQHHDAFRSSFTSSINQKALREAQYTRSLNDETVTELRKSLEAKSDTLQKVVSATPAVVDQRLKAHDRSIEALASTSQDNSNSSNEPELDESRIDLLARALIDLRGTALRDHLDRVFLESLTQQPVPSSEELSKVELRDLETDIKSLYVEIDDVLSMLISQSYVQPLKRASEQAKAGEQRVEQERLSATVEKLDSLTAELASLTEHVTATRSSQVLLQHFEKHLQRIDHDVNVNMDPFHPPTSESTVVKATNRFLEHVGRSRRPQGGPAGDTTGQDMSGILDTLKTAASTRHAAVYALASTQDYSDEDTSQLEDLERSIAEIRQYLEQPPT